MECPKQQILEMQRTARKLDIELSGIANHSEEIRYRISNIRKLVIDTNSYIQNLVRDIENQDGKVKT